MKYSQSVLSLTFRLHYSVEDPDDVLMLYCECDGSSIGPLAMRYSTSLDLWEVDLEVAAPSVEEGDGLVALTYHYAVCRGERTLRMEPPVGHQLLLYAAEGDAPESCLVLDRWIDPSAYHIYAVPPLAPLLGCDDQQSLGQLSVPLLCGTYVVSRVDQLLPGELYIVGDQQVLGSWSPDAAIALRPYRFASYAPVTIPEGCQYKYLLRQEEGSLCWEMGDNRHFPDPGAARLCSSGGAAYDMVLVVDATPSFACSSGVSAGGTSESAGRAAGVGGTAGPLLTGSVAPFFALRSSYSYGIGDISDAKRLVTLLSEHGQHVYQFLPLNDTLFGYSESDSYPYSAITTYGLHPLYLDLRLLPEYGELSGRQGYEQQAHLLNEAERIRYADVLWLKLEVMDGCYALWYDRGGYKEPDFVEYWSAEYDQLLPYCLFCLLRDRHPGIPVSKYPAFDSVVEEWVATRCVEGRSAERELLKHAYRQYHLHVQMLSLRTHAEACGVLLKGDLPIGVAYNSVDVWQDSSLFRLDYTAGAPPDAFALEGQEWGFPTYDWAHMAEDHYSWWQDRMRTMSRYLHALRIDHILGFFRIWSIPTSADTPASGHYVPAHGYSAAEVPSSLTPFFVRDESGIYHPLFVPEQHLGYESLSESDQSELRTLRDSYYYERNEDLWGSTAYARLSTILSSSGMLLCAEDLGFLSPVVGRVLSDLELLSLEVLRMPKQAGDRFVHPDRVPQLSVLTTSTHDTSSLRAWWDTLDDDERAEVTQLYGEKGTDIASMLRGMCRTRCAMLVLPLADWCAADGYGAELDAREEQINYPENPYHVWDYRMYGTIEEMAEHYRHGAGYGGIFWTHRE